jgi:phosphate transport system substrate-binding protein
MLKVAVAASPAAATDVMVHGAGSTFVAPLMQAWVSSYEKRHPNVALSYDAVGSGEGVARFESSASDFGASDVALAASEAAKIQRGVAQMPLTAGMIVLAYNLPGVFGELRLPKDVYVDIFLGKIKTWDDPRIRAANPGIALPSRGIAVVCRQDSSGTTYAFTDHLAAVSKDWALGPGVGKTIAWPHTTMTARGNEGVASRIKISEGAIGYVEYGFALRLNLPMATLENKAGQFVAPTPTTGAAALESTVDVSLNALDESTVNPSGPNAYPLVTYSWILLYRNYPADKGRALTAFVNFALEEGQTYAPFFGYLPLPPKIAGLGKAFVSKLGASDAPVASSESAKPAPEKAGVMAR